MTFTPQRQRHGDAGRHARRGHAGHLPADVHRHERRRRAGRAELHADGRPGRPTRNDDTYSNGVGNTQYSVGAGTPATPAVVVAGSVLSERHRAPATLTAGPASIASTNGGQVTMSSDGTFLYTPAVGFAGPSDTFTYTMTDANSATDTAVVTINMTRRGLVRRTPRPRAGDGRSHNPFNTMAARGHRGRRPSRSSTCTRDSPTGATVLKASQTLWGAGATFTLNGLTISRDRGADAAGHGHAGQRRAASTRSR